MPPFAAPLLGWMLGSCLLAAALAMGLSGMWAPALLLGNGGSLLWAWAIWLQDPELGRQD